MHHLQELYDYYLQCGPSRGKIKNATTLLIHICRAMNKNAPEEISSDLFGEIPKAIDELYWNTPSKSIQDKSMLAEMIGKYGPQHGWEKPLEILLSDPDENLRQFTLHSLEFCSRDKPELILPYIEKYKRSEDIMMRRIAAHLMISLMCSEKSESIKETLMQWAANGEREFIAEIAMGLRDMLARKPQRDNVSECKEIYQWIGKKFNID